MLIIFPCVKANADSINLEVFGGIFCLEEMSSVLLNSDMVTQVSRWEPTLSYAPTPGDFGRDVASKTACS